MQCIFDGKYSNKDFHVHTKYSGHSQPEMSVAAVVSRCADLDISHVCILEHVPPVPILDPDPSEWHRSAGDRSRVDSIFEELNTLSCTGQLAELAPSLKISVGVEVDADPFKLDGSLMLDDFAGLDFVLVASHLLPGGDLFWFRAGVLAPEAGQKIFDMWVKWMLAIISRGKPDVLAHPATMLCVVGAISEFDDETLSKLEPVVDRMAKEEVAFELNELMQAKIGRRQRESYERLVRLARARGVKFAVGSDAHQLDRIGQFSWVAQLVKAAGIGPEELVSPKRWIVTGSGAGREKK